MANKEEVLINDTPEETRVAVVSNGIVQELHLERKRSRGIVGNIFKGKVERVLPGMQAAFIDIGLQKKGFLHASDIVLRESGARINERQTGESRWSGQAPGIADLLSPGQSVWVQASKAPNGDKGARLTTDLS
ncbi:MAG: S1 RNA-binding domain-containing protein, partial [Gammaproteobacteria bacterium]|nr:S1 RNA-binding domain-containing protein [Gammaproteobacteria bacterium]